MVSGIPSSNKTYTHVNANVPTTKAWEYFIVYQKLCGIDTILCYSDTLPIDDQKPDSTILDSVSVDPITDEIYLGWTSNKTPDFSSYYLYNYDRTDPRLIENFRDTIYIDKNPPFSPKSRSLSYDITSSDSCDNRRDYGKYKHQTIYLNASIDTCLNSITLNWTAYVGWQASVYYIYRKTNSGSFVLIDSVSGSTLVYTDKNRPINSTFEYFVRTQKVGYPKITSTSNGTFILKSGSSANPTLTEIELVTNNNNDKIEISIKKNPLSYYQSINLMKIQAPFSPVLIHTYVGSDIIFEDLSSLNTNRNEYFLLSKNVCGIITDTSVKSGNMVLSLLPNTNDISLSWNSYFTWNAGIKEYIIYRATGNNISEATNYLALGSPQNDTSLLDPKISESTVCYQVAAYSNNNIVSRSNKACYVKTGKIYYPNALTQSGANKQFTFIGEGIDLAKSTIEIYNRWGQLEYNKENISEPWDGRNNSKDLVPVGVYFFIAHINQGQQTIEIHGNITVLN
ncbi:MAG: hypothetical protein CFE21_04625 [Bacteroidetes bacterium B1(2017)]|nr:MAG: hypothetical protein CFE21_04625 [Bacteroidetes bacterium B1(2017)]